MSARKAEVFWKSFKGLDMAKSLLEYKIQSKISVKRESLKK